jgi:trans-aconitate methyltransferase
MAHTNGTAVADITNVLGVALDDEVLELGFGPGVGIHLLVRRMTAGYVRGIDPSSN